MIPTKKTEYQDSEWTYEGIIAYNKEIERKLPAMIIAHAYG